MGIWSKIVDKDKNKKQFNNSLYNNDYNTPTLYGQITKEITPVNQVQSNNTYTPIANAVNNEVQGAGETNKTADDIMGLGSSAYSTYGNISGGAGGGGMGWIGIGQGAANGMGRFADSGEGKDIYEGFFGYDTEEDSDVMQSIKGTVNGAQMGSGFGPWGALIGGVAGLASSFIDDF